MMGGIKKSLKVYGLLKCKMRVKLINKMIIVLAIKKRMKKMSKARKYILKSRLEKKK